MRRQTKRTIELAGTQNKRAVFWFKSEPLEGTRGYYDADVKFGGYAAKNDRPENRIVWVFYAQGEDGLQNYKLTVENDVLVVEDSHELIKTP